MVGQFSLEVNRNDEPVARRRPLLPSSKPAEMRAFYSGTDKLWEFSFHVESLSIPPDQRTSGKSMTHVMEPGTTAMAFCRATETELLRYPGEGVARYPLRDPGTALGDEKGRGRFGKDAVSRLSVFS
jgi:hypothetical protein